MKWKVLTLLMLVGISAFAQKRMVFVTVTDSADNPLKGVEAVLTTLQHASEQKTATSDKKGRFTFYDVKPGDVEILMTLDGYLERKLEFRTKEDRPRDKFNVKMFREDESVDSADNTVMITGVVSGTDGQPLAGVTVIATVEGTPFEQKTETNDQGQYQVKALMNNELQLLGRLDEYRDQIVKLKVREREIIIDGPKDFVMQTLDEAYAAMGIDRPKDKPLTPEEEAVNIYNLAVDPYQQGNYEQAEKLARDAFSKDPKQVNALKLLVFANLKTEDWKDVLEFSEKYLALNPEDTNIRKAALQASQILGKTDKIEAIKGQLKAAGEISKDDLWNDCVNALNANDDAKAMSLIKEILEMDANDARAYFEMGKIKVREYEFEEAVKHLKHYLKIAPKDHQYRKEATDLILTLVE